MSAAVATVFMLAAMQLSGTAGDDRSDINLGRIYRRTTLA